MLTNDILGIILSVTDNSIDYFNLSLVSVRLNKISKQIDKIKFSKKYPGELSDCNHYYHALPNGWKHGESQDGIYGILNYYDNKLHGTQLKFDLVGHIFKEKYIYGVIQSRTTYHENTKKQAKKVYTKKGFTITHWNEDGALIAHNEFSNEEVHGNTTAWDVNGIVLNDAKNVYVL